MNLKNRSANAARCVAELIMNAQAVGNEITLRIIPCGPDKRIVRAKEFNYTNGRAKAFAQLGITKEMNRC